MRIIRSQKQFCLCCMKEHEVKVIRTVEDGMFKNVQINYEAEYCYCDSAEELYMDEKQMRYNDIALKDAYRKKQGLLTTREIVDLRGLYEITQSDLCKLLGWGEKTITRYESYQVQDRAHDAILKKLGSDPEWFLSLLGESKEKMTEEAYKRYLSVARLLYEKNQDVYLRKAIEAKYTKYYGKSLYCGAVKLSLDKVVEMIRFFASSSKVIDLYKVKLMKLMWYADAFSYKQRGYAITGLVYQALPMGAVPIGHESIISLRGVPVEEVDMEETIAYHFSLEEEMKLCELSEEERAMLEYVAEKLGGMSKKEIVEFMHDEKAYVETLPREIISFEYAKELQI